MKYTVKANTFVKRQVKGSGKTYSKMLSFDKIAELGKENLNNGNFHEGYRDGVVLIELKGDIVNQFICPLTKIDENSILNAKMVKRRDNEEPYIQIRALNGDSLKTDTLDLVLYRRDVLRETNEQTTDADWEVIAVMAKPKDIKMPMGPVTMMRNQLQKSGGTKGEYESEKWAESVEFWQEYAILEKK